MRVVKWAMLSSTFMMSTAVMAQTVPDRATDTAAASSDEIVVTAQRREQALSDVGMSITAIGAEALATRGVSEAGDLAKLVPGLSVSDSGYSTPLYTLRGVGINEPSAGSSSSVAVYVDEVPLAYPVMTEGAALDVQRIEVLKGPQGTLYGLNSTGGAINYIANKPTDDFEGGVTATYGRFNRASLEAVVSGPLTDTLKIRVAGRGTTGGDWQRSITRDDTRGKVGSLVGRMILEWTPVSNLKLTFNGNGWRNTSDTPAAQLVRVVPSVPANMDPLVLNAPRPGNNARDADWDPGQDFSRRDTFLQGSLRAVWDINDIFSFTSITSYSDMKRNQGTDLDGIGAAIDLRGFQRARIKSFAQEARLAADFSGINVLVGASYYHDKTDETLRQELPASSQVRGRSSGGTIIDHQNITGWAVFASADVPITSQLTLTAGIRYSEDDRKFRGCPVTNDDASGAFYTGIINGFRAAAGLDPYPTITAGQCYSFYSTQAVADLDTVGLPIYTLGEANRRLKQHNVPWNINLNFKPSETSLLYGRISRGYKVGNFSTLNTVDLVAYNPIPQEELTAYEIGARFSPSRAIRLEGALFLYDYNAKQLRARINVGPPFGVINAQDSIPKSRLKGAEASIVIKPVRELTLSASGTYVDSKIKKYTGYTVDGTPNQNFAGASFNYTPKYSVNIDANYDQPINDSLNLFSGVNYAYRSATSSVFTPPGYTSPVLADYRIKSYATVDAQLGVRSADSRWKAWLWGKNIFNKYYWTNVTNGADIVVRYAAMPATYGVSASFKF